MKIDDPNTRFSYVFDSTLEGNKRNDPSNPQIEVLFFQTPMMARNYEAYHDVVFLDSAYNTNQLGLQLCVFSGVSSEGKNIVLAVGLMAKESTENYTWIIENLLMMNNCT